VDETPHETVPTEPEAAAAPQAFRLGFAPGVIPAKWVRTWRDRLTVPLELVPIAALDAGASVRDGVVDAALVRRPVVRTGRPGTPDARTKVLHAIPLYDEVPVVVVGKEHLLSLADEVTIVDLAEEVVLHPLDDPFDWAGVGDDAADADRGTPPGLPAVERPADAAAAIALVAAGVGVVPMSVARLHHRKDVVHVPYAGGPTSGVSLVWPVERAHPLAEELVGIVRGRSVNSSRGAAATDTQQAAGGGERQAAPLTRAEKERRAKAAAARKAEDHKAARARKVAERNEAARAKAMGKKAAKAKKPGKLSKGGGKGRKR
jgi:DNA-binding transcriptional LysR family regulator